MKAIHATHDDLAASLGVVRNKRIIVPCSGCGVGCYAVEPLGCFCVKCYAAQKRSTSAKTMDCSAMNEAEDAACILDDGHAGQHMDGRQRRWGPPT